MYPVSEAFLQAVQENTRRYYWTGQITTKDGAVYPFVYEDIVKGSGYITAQCCGSAEIELGTVYAAEMGITLFSQIDRYTLEGAEVRLSYHLRLADGSFEEVPMGVFEVSEANRTAHCLELKAYDYMLRFEKSFNGFETMGNAYAFLDLCCKACAVELAHTQEEIEAMPNGMEQLSIYPENDIETYRDVLYFVGQVLGGFFCISREGKLELRKYGTEPVMEIKSRHRFTSSFSDFITRYTAVSSTNLRTQTAEYYALEPDNGLTMNLAVNPFLQFGLEETRETLCRNILNDLLYSITFADSSVRIRKVRIPIFTVGLNEKLDDSTYTVLEDHAVQTETFLFLGSYTKYGEFLDGRDGYWYGFSNEGNSSGNARMLWVKISKADYSMTEGEWTLSNAKLMAVGERDMENTYPERSCRCCMRGGYLYVPAYDKKGIYKINVANTADVSLVAFGFTSKMKPLGESGTCELYLTLVGDLIIGGDFQVTAADAVIHTQGSARLGCLATPLFQHKQFLVGWGGSYGNEYRHMYLLTPYLATINNLSSAVVKDANKTMKITYTLTEEA